MNLLPGAQFMSHNPAMTSPQSFPEEVKTAGIVKVDRGGVRWTLRSDWAEALVSVNAPDWENLTGDERARLVKTGHHRHVWRIALAKGSVFAKVTEAPTRSLGVYLRYALGRTAWHREWRNAVAALRRGAPVTRPIALGRRLGSSPTMILVTEAFENATNLLSHWCAALNESDRIVRCQTIGQLTRSVARLYADAHNAGFVHLDGHPGNILVARGVDGGFTAKFADATDARLSRGHPPWTWIIRSLAHLDHSMRRVASRAQRLRFLRRYLQPPHVSTSLRHVVRLEHKMVSAILAQRAVHAAALARQRDRRVTRSGKYFGRMSLPGGWSGALVLALERRHVFDDPPMPDFTERRWRELLDGLTDARGNAGGAIDRLAAADLCIRCATADGFVTAMRWRLVGPPLSKLFVRCHALRHRDIPAPLALGYLEHRGLFGGVDQAMLIYPRIKAAP